jgi:hypothetical protein
VPVLAQKAGFRNIGEKEVLHQERKYGTSKFGLNRFMNGFLDLSASVHRPLWQETHAFLRNHRHPDVPAGLRCHYLAGCRKALSCVQRIARPAHYGQPLFYIALTAMILGTQLFLAGFLGELISRSASERNNYQIEEEI